MASLATELPRQIQRVQEEVIPLYESLRGMPNVMVEPTIAMMKHACNEAIKAAASGDVIAMMRWHEELKGIEA
ncbi:hypothetical protein D6851_02395 [Altericroceibacterium spongiae]|uniref:FCD domain-containing protein n=1 Tax=Altericroceibacterium spongiae TaxID=2320269 RepID=A0A420ERQ1_9SPHN|nr:hypothetical protein [Altericroceibacterium spongiae]RKF23341.1 hypothetical protein D6851_02395 [Altericroceibacterium spongiae]